MCSFSLWENALASSSDHKIQKTNCIISKTNTEINYQLLKATLCHTLSKIQRILEWISETHKTVRREVLYENAKEKQTA